VPLGTTATMRCVIRCTALEIAAIAKQSPLCRNDSFEVHNCSRGRHALRTFTDRSADNALEMIQPQLHTTRSNRASDNHRRSRDTDCLKSASLLRLPLRCRGPQLLDLDSLVLTSPSLCGEIKVKVGCGRIEALHSLASVGFKVTILGSLNQPARKSMTG
jgi:hypothetical protein